MSEGNDGNGKGRIDWALVVAVSGLLIAVAQFFDPMGTMQRICVIEAAVNKGPCGR